MPTSKLDPPRQVIAALALLSVSVFLGNVPRTLLAVTGILSGRLAGADAAYKIADEIVIWGFSVGFLVLIAYGVNWARWVNLVLATLNMGFSYYLSAEAIPAQGYAVLILPSVGATLELSALYLLFLSPGRLWFEHRGSRAAA
jgi:hypothetical protein